MDNPDLYINQIGRVLVVAPAPDGVLGHLVERRYVVLNRETRELEHSLSRWIFADVPRGTLRDQWNNAYDHAAISLLSGTFRDGEAFIEAARERGLSVAQHNNLFVPLQKLDATSDLTSDNLRNAHPRAFALARRGQPDIDALLTAARDQAELGI